MSTNLSRIWNDSIINIITKKELLQILSDTESYNIERRESTGKMDKPCQEIYTFSNSPSRCNKNSLSDYRHQELSDLQVDDKPWLQIANIRTDSNILPQPIMTVEKFSFEEGDVWLQKCKFQYPPTCYRVRIWVRVDLRKSTATEAEEKTLTER